MRHPASPKALQLSLLLARQVGRKLNGLNVGQCIPETPIALCGSICCWACHRENDAKMATSVSPRVGNRTQWWDTELLLLPRDVDEGELADLPAWISTELILKEMEETLVQIKAFIAAARATP